MGPKQLAQKTTSFFKKTKSFEYVSPVQSARDGYKFEELRVIEHADTDPDVSWLEAEAEAGDAFAKKRLVAYERGDWVMIGIYVEAEIIVGGTVQKIRTPGLWNTESDLDKSYKREIAGEEYEELKSILGDLDIHKVPPLSSARWKAIY
jgi:hypothetical protein